MNLGPFLFLGVFLTFAFAWVGMVFMPSATLKNLKAMPVEASAVTNPRPYTGQEQAGRAIYQREGCVYCHTQQVRGGSYNTDQQRGWGARRSHPQDYIYDYPVLLGTMRTGPDLSNIGARQPSENWHYTHFYDPQLITPGSVMAPFSFLFTVHKIGVAPTPDALKFNYVYITISGDEKRVLADLQAVGFALVEQRGASRFVGGLDPTLLGQVSKVAGVKLVEPYVPAGFEIVPTDDARRLVAYVKSLDHTYAIEPAQNYGRIK